jgi:2-keto-3-deoxy-L-rhamnonate aldolase RhmA
LHIHIRQRCHQRPHDAILDVPGIDAIYVGPADLAFSLGKTPKLSR